MTLLDALARLTRRDTPDPPVQTFWVEIEDRDTGKGKGPNAWTLRQSYPVETTDDAETVAARLAASLFTDQRVQVMHTSDGVATNLAAPAVVAPGTRDVKPLLRLR